MPFDLGAHSACALVGDRLFVWSGGKTRAGGVYDLQKREWEQLPDAPILPRSLATARSHGTAVTVWGGWDSDGDSLTDGATFDFETGAWRRIPNLPAAIPYEMHPGW